MMKEGERMAAYKVLREGLQSRPTVIKATEDLTSYIKPNKDYYVSLYNYTEEQKQHINDNNTVKGIKDVVTTTLYFDFDSKDQLRQAQLDAVELAKRLIDVGVEQEAIRTYFSGSKGFSVELHLDREITVDQFKHAVFSLADGLATFDKVVNDANRIVRVPNTTHPVSKLYKIPLELWELDELSIDEIKALAANRREVLQPEMIASVPEKFFILPEAPEQHKEEKILGQLDWSRKPKFLSNCRWALQNGMFKSGNRNHSLLCLASTYKNLGFDLDHVYRLLKGVAQVQSDRNACDRFPDSELYNNIVMQVFSLSWNNGQYTCKTDGWLKTYCTELGDKCCEKSAALDAQEPHHVNDVSPMFKTYVKNIDKNTILTGIPSIDENVFLSTGANVAIIGAAGSGKSSICLNILNNTSKAGVKSVFASLDMHKTRMFEKIMYKISGLSREQLYEVFKSDKEAPYLAKLKEEFGNVFFYSKSSPTVQDIREYILECQERSGEKIKLVMLDYFERVSSDFNDDTQASKKVAAELQDLVNDLDICLITLVQPTKNALAAGPDAPIYDYTRIKGSSYLYQSFRVIMSLWRPFYTPKFKGNDNFMQVAVLKNDLGELNEFAFGWHGPSGTISELEDFQRDEFAELLKQKEAAKSSEKGDWE